MVKALFTKTIFCLAMVGLATLASCSKPAEIPHAATLDRTALMAIVFPNWQGSGGQAVQPIEVPMNDGGKQSPAESKTNSEILPLYVVKLSESHAVMLTQALPVDSSGEVLACHACQGYVGAYSFTRYPSGWRLTARQDVVAEIGVNGSLGKTQIVRVGENGFLFTADWGSCWQGYCGHWLALVSLQPDRAIPYAPDLILSAENTGAHEECDSRRGSAVISAPAHQCFDVKGIWKIQGDRLVANFLGHRTDLDSEGKHLPTKTIQQRAIYRIEKERLVLESGENPVPNDW
jgi:hypothetical protein